MKEYHKILKEIRAAGIEPDGFTVISMWIPFHPNTFLPREHMVDYPMSKYGKIGIARSENIYFWIVDKNGLRHYFTEDK